MLVLNNLISLRWHPVIKYIFFNINFIKVQRNLFRPHNAIGPVNEEDPLAEIMYFIFMNQEEHNYQHACLKYYTANGKTIKACDVITMIPRFYDIRPVEDYQNLDSKVRRF